MRFRIPPRAPSARPSRLSAVLVLLTLVSGAATSHAQQLDQSGIGHGPAGCGAAGQRTLEIEHAGNAQFKDTALVVDVYVMGHALTSRAAV